MGGPPRGVEPPRLARVARAFRRTADAGGGGAGRPGRLGDHGADRRRLGHRDAPVARAPAEAATRRSTIDVLVPSIFDNPVGVATVEARVLGARELHPPTSPRRTRHLEIALPAGVRYRTGDHLGVCPRNGAEEVERLARAPGGLARRAVHGAEGAARPRRAEGRRRPGAQRAHQPRRHRREADGRAGGRAAPIGDRRRASGAGWRRSGRSCARRKVRRRRCVRRSTPAATTCCGCSTPSRRPRSTSSSCCAWRSRCGRATTR